MNTYIATFFMHFGSIRYERLCKSKGLEARTMPVPRSLSSSCGTCVRFECEDLSIFSEYPGELDKIALQEGNGYREVYNSSES